MPSAPRRSFAGTPGASVGLAPLLFACVLLLLPGGAGDVVLEFLGAPAPAGSGTIAPMTAGVQAAGGGACRVPAVGTVPAVVKPARGSEVVTEPRTCPPRTPVVLLPALNLTNALPATVGHTLRGAVRIESISGSGAMIRSLQLYLQSNAPGNPIVTGTHARVRAGTVLRAESSFATLATARTYGLGLSVTLNRNPTVSTAVLSLAIELEVDDGGIVRAEVIESVTLSLTY